MRCVFCEIARGRGEAFVVYRGEKVIAFLDRYPVTLGHTLVAPIEHYVNVFDLPDDLLSEMALLARRVALAQRAALGAPAVRLVMNSGVEAGQVIMHAHLHAIPYGVERLNREEIEPRLGTEAAAKLREALLKL